jgi:FtsZ-binding cell division protein ZapB
MRKAKKLKKGKNKQVKEIHEIIQDLKMEIEEIKETQPDRILEMENLGKQTELQTKNPVRSLC